MGRINRGDIQQCDILEEHGPSGGRAGPRTNAHRRPAGFVSSIVAVGKVLNAGRSGASYPVPSPPEVSMHALRSTAQAAVAALLALGAFGVPAWLVGLKTSVDEVAFMDTAP